MKMKINPPLPNLFKRALRARELQIGCWCSLANPFTTEILGLAGFNWLLLDAEHAPNDLNSLILQLMALKDSPSAAVVRPEWRNSVLLKRLLDSGFYNFLIPFIESASEAKEVVKATRYPPLGIRGVSVAHRGNNYGYLHNYMEEVNDNICLIAQIESLKGYENVDEIASVDGIDALFIGPSDLAAGLGHLGQPHHIEVQEAIKHIFTRAKAHNKSVGILASKDAKRYLEMGATFAAVGSDLALFRDATKALREEFK